MPQEDQVQERGRTRSAQLIQEPLSQAPVASEGTQHGGSKPTSSAKNANPPRSEEDWNVDTVRLPRLRRPSRLQHIPLLEKPTAPATIRRQKEDLLSPIGLGHLDELDN